MDRWHSFSSLTRPWHYNCLFNFDFNRLVVQNEWKPNLKCYLWLFLLSRTRYGFDDLGIVWIIFINIDSDKITNICEAFRNKFKWTRLIKSIFWSSLCAFHFSNYVEIWQYASKSKVIYFLFSFDIHKTLKLHAEVSKSLIVTQYLCA